MISQLAKADHNKERSVVLDYVMLDSSTNNFTFQGDTTYYISGNVGFSGTTTFEGGTVIKYVSDPYGTGDVGLYVSQIGGNKLNWLAKPYRPVILTAADDDSVGETISGSTGTPSGYYADVALNIQANSLVLSNVRISYAWTGIYINKYAGTGPIIKDAQINNCYDGIEDLSNVYSYLENVLFENIPDWDLYVDGYNFGLQNVTFNNANYGVTGSGSVAVFYTNCILANVTNDFGVGVSTYGDYNGFYNSQMFGIGNHEYNATVYPFQSVGAGNYYLTNGCGFQNVGTTNINPILLAELQTKTTLSADCLYTSNHFNQPDFLSASAAGHE